jgi:hypothetical protein
MEKEFFGVIRCIQTGLISGRHNGAHSLRGRSDHPTLSRLLHERDEPQIADIDSLVQFHLNILRKDLPLPQVSNLYDTSDHCRVCQFAPRIFAARNLRFRPVEGDGNVNIRLA